MRLFCILLLTLITLLSTTFAQTASKRRLVANLKNNTVADGCGCYFQFWGSKRDSERYMFVSPIDDDKAAWMNIAGRDVRLSLVKEKGLRIKEQLGSRHAEKYSAGNITVNATYITTRICDPNDENCESSDYSATFVVRKAQKTQTVKAFGTCGC